MFLGCPPCCASCPNWADVASCTLSGQASYSRSSVNRGSTTWPAVGNSAGFDITLPFYSTTGNGLRASHADGTAWPGSNFLDIWLYNWFGSDYPEDRYIQFFVTMGSIGRFGFGYYPCGLPTLVIEPGNPNPTRDFERDLHKKHAAFSFYDGYFESSACTLDSYGFEIASNFNYSGAKSDLGTRTTGLGGSCPDSFVSSTYFSGPVIDGAAALPLALSADATILTPEGNTYSQSWSLSLYSFVLNNSAAAELPAFPYWFSSFAI